MCEQFTFTCSNMLIPEGDKCTYEPAVTGEQAPELACPYQH